MLLLPPTCSTSDGAFSIILSGSKEKSPPADPLVGGGLMSLMSPFYSRGPIDITGRKTAALLPQAKLIELPDVGHGLYLSHASLIADEISAFG